MSGDSLKFALCISAASDFRGAARKGDLRFFTESKSGGRTYYQPEQLSQASYTQFDISATEVPVPLSYCFSFPSKVEVQMGKN